MLITPFLKYCEGIRHVRETVFVKEQSVPLELEWDGRDETATHAIARLRNGQIIATARLLADGHIGRMAVLKERRGMGVGSALLKTLCTQAADRGIEKVQLAAQTHATGFYQNHGFVIEGEEFLDAGIPHRSMYLLLKSHKI